MFLSALKTSCKSINQLLISAHIDHVWIKALVLVAIHLAAPLMRPWLKNKERVINAFGGGLAISYVFLHLLPEVAEGKEHLGMYSFFIVLCGFVFFYLANVLAKRSNKNASICLHALKIDQYACIWFVSRQDAMHTLLRASQGVAAF